MTTSQVRDGVEFCCDVCGDTWSPPRLGRGSEPRDFQESLALAKEAGFRAVNVGNGKWEHRCSTC